MAKMTARNNTTQIRPEKASPRCLRKCIRDDTKRTPVDPNARYIIHGKLLSDIRKPTISRVANADPSDKHSSARK